MTRPTDLLAIPPLARTVIYYALALANVVVGALVTDGRVEPLWLVIVAGVSGVFFGVAGSNVRATQSAPTPAPETFSEFKPEDYQAPGYMSGV